MNKRERKQREREAAERKYRFAVLAGETLRAPGGFAQEGFDVADVEIIPRFDGRPDDMHACLIFRTTREADEARARHDALMPRARALLEDCGFPAQALATFTLSFASEPEIEAGGGRFFYFR